MIGTFLVVLSHAEGCRKLLNIRSLFALLRLLVLSGSYLPLRIDLASSRSGLKRSIMGYAPVVMILG